MLCSVIPLLRPAHRKGASLVCLAAPLGLWAALLPASSATAAAAPRLVLQLGHTDAVYAIAFSPDGKTVASASVDKSVMLWDLATGQLTATLDDSQGAVEALAYSPDGRTLASGSGDGVVRLWDVRTATLVTTLTGFPADWLSVTYSPDGRTLAIAGTDGAIQLWDVGTQTWRQPLMASHGADGIGVLSLAYSPDGRTLAAGTAVPGDASPVDVQLWDTGTGQLQRLLPGHRHSIWTIAYSPDGRTLASGDAGGVVKLWDARTGRLEETIDAGQIAVYSLQFSHDSLRLASAGSSGWVEIWSAATGHPIGPTSEDGADVITYSPDGSMLAAGRYDGTIDVWDARSGRLRQSLKRYAPPKVGPITYSPAAGTLAVGAQTAGDGPPNGYVLVWNPRTATLEGTLAGYGREITALSVSPDGKSLATLGDQGLEVWEVAARRLRHRLKDWSLISPLPILAFRPDSRSLIAGSADGVNLWEVSTGARLGALKIADPWSEILSFALSPDGVTLAAGTASFDPWSDDPSIARNVVLWDLRTGKVTRTVREDKFTFPPPDSGAPGADGSPPAPLDLTVDPLLFSPDGSLLAGGTSDGLQLWDALTGRPGPLLPDGHVGTAFSPDGKTLVTTAGDLWDTESGLAVGRLAGADAAPGMACVAFSPNGRQIAGGDDAGSIRLWEASSGRLLVTIRLLSVHRDARGAPVFDWLALTPEGYYDGSAGAERFIRWRVGERLLPARAYAPAFHRPDRVRQALAGMNGARP